MTIILNQTGQYTFTQNAANKLPVAGNDGHLFDRSLCYNCQTYGILLATVLIPKSGELL